MIYRHAIVAFGLAVVLLVGIGPHPATAQTSQPIKIGIILPLTGPAAAIGQENLQGLQFVFDQNNNNVDGHPIQLVTADDQNTPNVGLTEVRRLVENEKVSAIIGNLNSAVALAVDAYTTRAQIPYISGPIVRDLTDARKSPYTFRGSVAAGQMEGVIAKFVIQQGWPRLILMGSDYAAGHDAVSAVGSDLKLLHGSVVSEIFPRAGETDYAPYFSRLVDAEADAVYGFFFAGDTLRYVRQYKSSGLKLPLVITDNALASGGVAAALGSDIDGVYSVEYWIWTLTDPETIAFVRDYTKKFGMPPEGIAYCGYIEGRVMMEALKARHGVITNGEDLANAMKAVSFEAPGGPFKFDANNNPIVNGYLVHWAWNGSKPVPTVLETVRGITQDSIPAP